MTAVRFPSVIAALALLGGGQAHAGTTLDRVTRTGVMTEILINTYPPFGFIDANNQVAGFDVDVARAVADKLGVKLKLETPAWEAIVGGHWQGRWDVCICSMTPTAEREKVLNFPVSYYSSPAVITVHKNDQRIKSAADLSGKRVGVGIGSSYEEYLNKALVIPGAGHIDYPFHDVIAIPGDESVNFRNLALGPGVRLDAIVSSFSTAKWTSELGRDLKVVGPTLFAESSFVATEKGDPEWDRTIERIITQLTADGTISKISLKWVGTDLSTAKN